MDQKLTGKTIAQLRKNAGHTQASLAKKLGISDKAISKWERGIACPDVSLWNKLSIILNTDIENLIYGHTGESKWNGCLILDESVPANTTVYNKPLIHYLISQFLLVGITNITIVGECQEIKFPGVEINVCNHINHRFSENTFVIYGNSYIYGPNLTRHIKRAMSRNGVTILASIKNNGKYSVEIDGDRKAKLTNKMFKDQYFAEPYVFYGKGSELKNSIEEVLSGECNAETLSRGMFCIELDSYDKILDFSEYIKIMENLTSEKIACIEEIIIRRGIAMYEDVEKISNEEIKTYLKKLQD